MRGFRTILLIKAAEKSQRATDVAVVPSKKERPKDGGCVWACVVGGPFTFHHQTRLRKAFLIFRAGIGKGDRPERDSCFFLGM